MTTTTLSPFRLSRLADCAEPSDFDSPGARFLQAVAEHVAERRNDGDDPHDLAHEIADAAVPVYTCDLWSTFVDLSAWHEDVSELVGDDADMTRRASVALYAVGERLALALLEG